MPNSTTPTTADVPAEVQRKLSAAVDLAPGKLPDDAPPEQEAEWWRAMAAANEAHASAYEELHQWAIDTGQPGPVVTAIAAATYYHRDEARRSRRQAQRALR